MYQRILVPVDGSPTSLRGLEEGIRIAASGGGRLRMIHVVDQQPLLFASANASYFDADSIAALRARGGALLARAVADARRAGIEADSVMDESVSGAIHTLILDEAARWHADLIVAGTHGRRGVSRLVLGSSAENIARLSPVPVLLVRPLPNDRSDVSTPLKPTTAPTDRTGAVS